jgi:hypothetical protein
MSLELTNHTKGSLGREYGNYSVLSQEESPIVCGLIASAIIASVILVETILISGVMGGIGVSQGDACLKAIATKFAIGGCALGSIPLIAAIVFGVKYARFNNKKLTKGEVTGIRSAETENLSKVRSDLTVLEGMKKIEGSLTLAQFANKMEEGGSNGVSATAELLKERRRAIKICLIVTGVLILLAGILSGVISGQGDALKAIWITTGALSSVPLLVALSYFISLQIKHDDWKTEEERKISQLKNYISCAEGNVGNATSNSQIERDGDNL